MVKNQRSVKFFFLLILLLSSTFSATAEKAEEGKVDIAPGDNTAEPESTTRTPQVSNEAGSQVNEPKEPLPVWESPTSETPIVLLPPFDAFLESQARAPGCQYASNCGPIHLDCGTFWEGDCCINHCPLSKGCAGVADFCRAPLPPHRTP